MGEISIPDALKADVPQTLWGKVLAATPVVMTVVATALAGLSSSEMTRAQYSRSYAAQLQSKAGDQWGFFQAKRQRSTLQKNALDLLRSTADVRPLDAAVLKKAGVDPDSPAGKLTVAALQKGELPPAGTGYRIDPGMKAAMDAIEDQKPDADVSALLAPVSAESLAESLRTARAAARAMDASFQPVNQHVDQLEKSLAGADRNQIRDLTAARLRYTASRYDAEARLNQAIANLYELQVCKENLVA